MCGLKNIKEYESFCNLSTYTNTLTTQSIWIASGVANYVNGSEQVCAIDWKVVMNMETNKRALSARPTGQGRECVCVCMFVVALVEETF